MLWIISAQLFNKLRFLLGEKYNLEVQLDAHKPTIYYPPIFNIIIPEQQKFKCNNPEIKYLQRGKTRASEYAMTFGLWHHHNTLHLPSLWCRIWQIQYLLYFSCTTLKQLSNQHAFHISKIKMNTVFQKISSEIKVH